MTIKSIEEDPGQNLASNGEQGYTPVIVAYMSVALPFVQVNDGCIFELLGQFLPRPDQVKEVGQIQQ